jgi:hypothetical protein
VDDRQFDQLARILAWGFHRRGLFTLAAVFGGWRLRAAEAAQLTPPACGELGGACTLSFACCSGLTCVTSTLNPSYGVCVTGDSGMMAAVSGVVAPGEDFAQQLAPAVAAQAAAPTTDPRAEREQRMAEKKARKSAKKSKQKSRKATRKNRRQTKRSGGNRRARLQLIFLDPTSKRPETVRVRNLDNESVVLTSIESIQQPGIFRSLNLTLAAGQAYLLSSGVTESDANPDPDEETVWTEKKVCRGADDGITLRARVSSSSSSFDFTAACPDGSSDS